MFVNKCGCVRRTPNWVRMDSVIGVWGWEGASFPGRLLRSDFESSPSWRGWHVPEPCRRGQGPLNTGRGSGPWDERERRALSPGAAILRSPHLPARLKRLDDRCCPLPFSRRSEAVWKTARALSYPRALGEHSAWPPPEGTDLACDLVRATSRFWPLIFPWA